MIDVAPENGMPSGYPHGRRLAEPVSNTESRTPPAQPVTGLRQYGRPDRSGSAVVRA